ncbi:MAG: hypothetical protein ACUVT9_04760, partial [Candidatus Bathycorpusculaceae bacterium]
FKCAVCQKTLGRLTIATLKKMFDDFPKELAKEWLLEIKERKLVQLNLQLVKNLGRLKCSFNCMLPNSLIREFSPLLFTA